MEKKAFALFDFDDTLSRGDSILPYLLYAIKKGKAPWYQLLTAFCGFVSQVFIPERARRAKEMSLSFLKGKSRKEMDELARGFFRDVIMKKHIFPESVPELRRLREEGCRILIVSASVQAYMQVLPEFLPVDDVIATQCGMDEYEIYDGRIGENCKGYQKPLRIAAYLAAHGWELDHDRSWAYGDSASDAPMLQLVANPRGINPKKKLLKQMPDLKTLRWGKKQA